MYWTICLFLSTRVDFSFEVHKLAKFSLKPGKAPFEYFVHLLRYIRDNNNLGLNYYADKKDSTLSDLLRQANIKNENQLMAFYDFSWKYCTDTERIKRSYMIL